jgi:SAM-dependent methyltransferase
MHTRADLRRLVRSEGIDLRGAWEEQAEAWTRWARAPAHDSYWRWGREAFFSLLPPPGRRTVDVGCGEGRVSRDLTELGHRVVGIDVSRSMAAAARDAAPEIPVIVADAAAIPIAGESCDLAIAYMSLQDIDDMPSAISEVARVLQPRGRLCMAVVHPMNSAGQFESLEPEASFIIDGSYLKPHHYVDNVERAELRMRFSSLHHPLEEYFKALESAGFLVEAVREVPVGAWTSSDDPRHERWRRLPLFLHVRAVKP